MEYEIVNEPDWTTKTTSTSKQPTAKRPKGKTTKPKPEPKVVKPTVVSEAVAESQITNLLNRSVELSLADSSTLRLRPNQSKIISKQLISPDIADMAKRRILAIN